MKSKENGLSSEQNQSQKELFCENNAKESIISNTERENEVGFCEKRTENSILYTDKSADFNKNSESKKIFEKEITVDPVSANGNLFNTNLSQNPTSEEEENLIFSKLFPGVLRQNVEKDECFKLFAQFKDKNRSFSLLYSDYLALVKKISDSATEKALFSLQNKASSPGSLASTANSDSFFTREQVLRMSHEEISKNYDKIRKSQENW